MSSDKNIVTSILSKIDETKEFEYDMKGLRSLQAKHGDKLPKDRLSVSAYKVVREFMEVLNKYPDLADQLPYLSCGIHDLWAAYGGSAVGGSSEQKHEETKKKHILVVGGTGFIGAHTVVELVTAGYEVSIIDNLVNSSAKVIDRLEKILKGYRPHFENVDLCDNSALTAYFKKNASKFHAVLHFAALKAVGESIEKPLLYYQNNIIGTINLLKAMETFNVKNIIFSSSATVYGNQEKVPIAETAPIGEITNPYGQTKLMIEIMLKDLVKGKSQGKPWRVGILRYFNPVGAHSSGLIGEDPNGIPNNLAPYIAQVAVGRREFLSVFGNDYPTVDGTGVRDFIHVVDLAKGHVAVLEKAVLPSAKDEETTYCDVFNLGTGRGTSVLELLSYFSKACGKTLPYKVCARRAGDIATCYADPSKAAKLLGWKATLSVEQGAIDHYNWQSKNPNGYATSSTSSS